MIVSHKYRFIFIKTRKTAGTSIEVDLNRVLGAEDIATPIRPAVKGHIAQNYVVRNKFFRPTVLKNHMTARSVRRVVGESIWSDYFKFCVEREPVNKTLSHYSMLVGSPHHNQETKGLSFDDYVGRREFPVDTEKYTCENGHLIVDRVLRYEDLDNELRSVANFLGFSFELSAREKAGFRLDLSISREQSEIIYESFASSNRITGYRLG